MSALWTDDVSLLYKDGRIRELFPARSMTFPERVNALVRLIIFAAVCIYLYNRDTKYLLYAVFAIALITGVAKFRRSDRQTDNEDHLYPPCTHPTPNNPFANVLLTDYKDNPNKPPACNVDAARDEIEKAYAATQVRTAGQRDFSINSFYTMPDTSTYCAGREDFARALYGTGPTCKQDQRYCGGY